jgi:uncharacterized protein YecE (DUF72 family)
MKLSQSILIGTSGWHYGHWRGPFYPPDLAPAQFLAFYAGRFVTAEVNNTFYQMPEKKTLLQWRETVPDDFVFAVKASRFITHMKKLKDPKEPVGRFFRKIRALEEKLGPVLFQLPPRWRVNPERMEAFLSALPRGQRCALEFRDPSWFREDIYRLLVSHNAAFCIYDFDQRLSPRELTADFVYVRLHGPNGPYQGEYDTRALSGWAGALSAWSEKGLTVYCYFDNDQAGYAALNASRLRDMLQKG